MWWGISLHRFRTRSTTYAKFLKRVRNGQTLTIFPSSIYEDWCQLSWKLWRIARSDYNHKNVVRWRELEYLMLNRDSSWCCSYDRLRYQPLLQYSFSNFIFNDPASTPIISDKFPWLMCLNLLRQELCKAFLHYPMPWSWILVAAFQLLAMSSLHLSMSIFFFGSHTFQATFHQN